MFWTQRREPLSILVCLFRAETAAAGEQIRGTAAIPIMEAVMAVVTETEMEMVIAVVMVTAV
ncbi:hypothetical protein D3C85_1885180 [compost metagenome]